MKIQSRSPFPQDPFKAPIDKKSIDKKPAANDPYDLDFLIQEAPDQGPQAKELTRSGNTCQCNVSMSCACTSSCSGCCGHTRTCNGCR